MHSVRDKRLGRKKLIEKMANFHIFVCLFLWPYSLFVAFCNFPSFGGKENVPKDVLKKTKTSFSSIMRRNWQNQEIQFQFTFLDYTLWKH